MGSIKIVTNKTVDNSESNLHKEAVLWRENEATCSPTALNAGSM